MKSIVLRLTGALIVTFSAFIATARYTAQAYAAPQHVFSFDPTDCYLPCVFGITPGKTTWHEYYELATSSVPPEQQTFGGDTDFWLKDNVGTKIEFSANYLGKDNLRQTITYPGLSLCEFRTGQGLEKVG